MPNMNLHALGKAAVKNSVLIVMLLLIAMFSVTGTDFLTVRNLVNLVNQNTYFIIASVGLAFVMLGGGIDLSVGYQMSLVGVVVAMLMTLSHIPVPLAIAAGIVIGALLGLVSGLIVTKLNVFPLIATLGLSTVYQGISYQLTQARTFRQFPDSFRMISTGRFLGVHLDVYLAIIVVLVAAFILRKTYLGRHIFAVGGNADASRLSGIRVDFIKVLVYVVCGMLFAVATIDMISKSNTTSSSFGPGTEFTCMTAAIIGGISFKGGKGGMVGLVIGVFVLQILGNGMQLSNWGTYSQYIVKGLILVLAISLDGLELKPETIRPTAYKPSSSPASAAGEKAKEQK
ncbi:MAG TPA: ABC transporter permease [Rectinemataceae bacterium]|nr:ABC transporter permease [Rectinemataceae bacterium]